MNIRPILNHDQALAAWNALKAKFLKLGLARETDFYDEKRQTFLVALMTGRENKFMFFPPHDRRSPEPQITEVDVHLSSHWCRAMLDEEPSEPHVCRQDTGDGRYWQYVKLYWADGNRQIPGKAEEITRELNAAISAAVP